MSYTNQDHFFDDGIMPMWEVDDLYPFGLDSMVEQNEVEQNEDDILTGISPAALLVGDHIDECKQGFQFSLIPPSRTNTEVVGDEDAFKPTYNDHDTWARAVISNNDPIPSSSVGSSAPPSVAGNLFSEWGFHSHEQCELCQDTYKNPSLRKKHILKHIKPYKCIFPGCKRDGEGFATPNDLERHAKSVHKEGTQVWYKCAYPKCAKTNKDHFFDRKDNFNAHIKRRHEHLKQTSAIERLVTSSEYHPTAAEVKTVLLTKGSGLSRTNSAARAGSSRARKMKARSERSDDASSVCSPSPIEASSSTQPLDIPASAPEPSYMAKRSFGSIDEAFAGIGGAAEMSDWKPSVIQGKGKGRQVSMGNAQPNLQPRSPFAAHSFDLAAHRLGYNSGQSTRPIAAPTSNPQEVFQAIPQDQYAGSRLFDSDLSAQLQDRRPASYPGPQHGFSDAMQHGHNRRQTQASVPRGGAYPGMIQTTDLDNNHAFTAWVGSHLSVSPIDDPALQPPVYSDSFSSSSPIDLAFGATSSAHQPSSVSSMSFDGRFNATFQDMAIDPKIINPPFLGNDTNMEEG